VTLGNFVVANLISEEHNVKRKLMLLRRSLFLISYRSVRRWLLRMCVILMC